jgi:hypothetical protein
MKPTFNYNLNNMVTSMVFSCGKFMYGAKVQVGASKKSSDKFVNKFSLQINPTFSLHKLKFVSSLFLLVKTSESFSATCVKWLHT